MNIQPPIADTGTAMAIESMVRNLCLTPEQRTPSDYDTFLDQKSQMGTQVGFAPTFLPDFLFDFQSALVDWSVRKGRAALFVDTGLGKTAMQLVWAENMVRHTNKPVLILTPLSVSFQTVAEAKKFGMHATRCSVGLPSTEPGIYVTNYERLHYFDSTQLGGIVCDESGILKSFEGATRKAVTEFMRKMPYRLLCTATPSPNDYVELGTSSEALGELGHMDMLARFFKNQNNTADVRGHWKGHAAPRMFEQKQWRFKRHAEMPFWRWVSSWARAVRKPSDLGFDNTRFILPPLIEREHLIEVKRPPDGMLFTLPAVGLTEQRDERRRTITERCEKVAALVADHTYSMVWVHLNDEGDLLETLIPHSLQVSGSDSDEWKEMAALWFMGRKCICQESWFRAKLTTWQKDLPVTGKPYIKNTENISLGDKKSISKQSATYVTNTQDDTTVITRKNGKEHANNKIKSTRKSGNGTPTILKSDSVKLPRLNNTDSEIQTHESSGASQSMGLVLPNTTTLSKEGALFVERERPLTFDERGNFTSTIATKPERSEEYSVNPVILDSESLEMTQTDLSEPSCICGHKEGPRRLISKPTIFGYGLNFQFCSHVTFFPSHSFEQYYQSVRRCYRFGQKQQVSVDIVTTPGEQNVLRNLQRKTVAADAMFSTLMTEMSRAAHVAREVPFVKESTVPSWL